MELVKKRKQKGVVIQIRDNQKENDKNNSLSFTIHNSNINEIYNRIYNMFESLENSEDGVMLFHHK